MYVSWSYLYFIFTKFSKFYKEYIVEQIIILCVAITTLCPIWGCKQMTFT